uniref:C2H2-type domain-containing protein n=1 Tax=Globisporangium ultimum (strain ATCC 200006 / CBS 805.95 / DAOM BR144) TaxID=431595 RepID=K3XA98_GLOUD
MQPSGYDEYEGIFGPLGVYGSRDSRYASRGFRGANASNGGGGGRSAQRGQRRSAGSAAFRRTAASTHDFDARSKYLAARQSKRRMKLFGADSDAEDDENAADDATAFTSKPPSHPVAADARQVWLPTRSFSFRQRAGKLDVRAIARLDLEKIVATTDIDAIQRHLENLAFADVTLEDVQRYSDAYFLKLFQIAQLTLEYLLNVQDSLVTHSEDMETQCEQLLEECQQLETENDKCEAEIAALKKDIRQKQRTLATFEVMLLNASTAQRRGGARASGSMEKENAAKEANALVDKLLERSVDAKEQGAIESPVDCVICSKKFISAEYLLRHQQRKHQQQRGGKPKRCSKKKASSSSKSSRDEDDEDDKPRKTKTHPLPPEVVKALEEKNEIAKQLVQLQGQWRCEQEAREAQSKLLEGQQSQLTSHLVGNLSKLQDMLVEIEKKQETTKQDMMRYTQETITRLQQDAANAQLLKRTESRAGRLESDEEEDEKRRSMTKKAKDADADDVRHEQQLEKMMEVFFKAQAQQQQEIDALAQENSKLLQKKTKQKKKKRYEADSSSLLQMAALDARRFGIDHGGEMTQQEALSPAVKAVVLEDKLVQTDDEDDRKEADSKTISTSSQEVQTEPITLPIVEKTPVPAREPARRQSLNERKPQPSAIPKPKPKLKTPVEEKQTPVIVEETKTEPLLPAKLDVPPPEDNETRLQHAAHLVGKVALGFLTRKTLQNPANWLISLPLSALETVLSGHEFRQLRARMADNNGHQHSTSKEISVEVEQGTTANELRAAIAQGLSSGDQEGSNDGVTINYHRIVLHHTETHEELHGDQSVYGFKNQIEIEIIPCYDAAEDHVADVVDFHNEISDRLHEVKRASLSLSPGTFELLAGAAATGDDESKDSEDARDLALRRLVRLQARVRSFLAKRKIMEIKIDRLVDARVLKMRRLSTLQRQNTSSPPSDPEVAQQRKKVEQRLAATLHDKLQAAGTRSTRSLSTEAYGQHVQALVQDQSKLPGLVQLRIQELQQRLEHLVKSEYDPVKAKVSEQQSIAATKIQGAVQVATARRRLRTLLGRDRQEKPSPTEEEEEEKETAPTPDSHASDPTRSSPREDDTWHHSQSLDAQDLDDDFDAQEIEKLANAYEDGIVVAESTEVTSPRVAHEDDKAADEKEDAPPATEQKRQSTLAPMELDDLEEKPRSQPVVRRTMTITPPLRESNITVPPQQQRAGTPVRQVETGDSGHSPRPQSEREVISPFSKTPLLSRRGRGAPVTRRGSGYDNAR